MTHATISLNEPLSPPRIGGIAAALAIHVAALMMLMAPMTYAPSLTDATDSISPPVEFIEPEKIKPTEAPPINKKQEAKPIEVKFVQQQVITKPDVPPVIFENGETNDTQYVEPLGDDIGPVIDPPSGPISLSTEFAPPPRYPPASLRNGETGTVLLLVKVDAAGKPIDVTLKKSSGYRELDKNAMRHVLATWRFHPAMHKGVAIPALALVPVVYKIDQ